MKPLKGAQSLGNWLLRLSLLLFIFLSNWNEIFSFNFKSLSYVLLLIFAILTILLFIGGFMRKHSMTVWSGLLIFLLSVAIMIMVYVNTQKFGIEALVYMMPAAIGFYFAAKGNNN